jgi:carbonic anhydrase
MNYQNSTNFDKNIQKKRENIRNSSNNLFTYSSILSNKIPYKKIIIFGSIFEHKLSIMIIRFI